MTDYEGEQAMELEALEAILMDDLQEVDDTIPSGWKPQGKVWRVALSPQQQEEEQEYPLQMELVFAHTPSYPDEPPLLRARGLQGLSDAHIAAAQALLEEQAQENLGMAMIYTLIGALQEWLEEKANEVAQPHLSAEEEEKRRREAEEERLAELRRHGTAVTPEVFNEWLAKFEAEQALAAAKLDGGGGSSAAAGGAAAGAAAASKKEGAGLTGKQWFLQQEAAHIEIEEPELGEDEADGEDDRANWSCEDEDFEESDDEDDEDLLEQMLAAKGGA